MLPTSSISCAVLLGLPLGDFYNFCCRPERLREPGIKNRSREPPGLNAGIARQRTGESRRLALVCFAFDVMFCHCKSLEIVFPQNYIYFYRPQKRWEFDNLVI